MPEFQTWSFSNPTMFDIAGSVHPNKKKKCTKHSFTFLTTSDGIYYCPRFFAIWASANFQLVLKGNTSAFTYDGCWGVQLVLALFTLLLSHYLKRKSWIILNILFLRGHYSCWGPSRWDHLHLCSSYLIPSSAALYHPEAVPHKSWHHQAATLDCLLWGRGEENPEESGQ